MNILFSLRTGGLRAKRRVNRTGRAQSRWRTSTDGLVRQHEKI